jgi:hypothetical protein
MIAAFTALVAAGCGRGEPLGGPPSDTPSAGSSTPAAGTSPTPGRTPGTDLPTLTPPPQPPKTPTDDLPADWIVGTVTRGGDGPCYGVETNDGVPYAVYRPDGPTLSRGDPVRVRIAPLELKISCGPGHHVRAVTIEVVR